MTALTAEHATMPVLGRLDPHATRAEQIAHIAEAARQIRIQDAKLVHYAGAGHIGGDFSAIDVLATLYGAVLNVTPETVDDPERDRFILSKGHVAGALYTTLAAFGFLEVEELATFLKPLSRLNGHPNRNKVPGVEANTGPLGHGLPIAVGHAHLRQARRVPAPHLRAHRRRRAAGGQQLGGHDGRLPVRAGLGSR